jgi:sulfatase modifying factor 1
VFIRIDFLELILVEYGVNKNIIVRNREKLTMKLRGSVFCAGLFLSIFASLAFANSAPNVYSVSASQRGDGSGIVDIYYWLTDADGDNCTVSVTVSDNGGSTWAITPSAAALSGDVGAGISSTTGGKHILWYSKQTLPGAYGTNYRVKVCAEDNAVTGPIPMSDFLRTPTLTSVATTTFEMGDHSGIGSSNELPIHTVTLNAFYMCKYEVTNLQYRTFLNEALAAGEITVYNNVVFASGDTSYSQPYFSTYESTSSSNISYSGSSFLNVTRSNINTSNHPVVYVSWYGAKAFCDFYGYRLPTEAEWERAARSGNLYFEYPWGSNTIDSTKCNYNMNNPMGFATYPYTTPVGYYSSPTGYYDMAGNVWEWCNDWYSSNYYSSSPSSNPTGPTTGSYRVIRGGGWYDSAYYCRVAYRYDYGPVIRDFSIGFRVCLY